MALLEEWVVGQASTHPPINWLTVLKGKETLRRKHHPVLKPWSPGEAHRHLGAEKRKFKALCTPPTGGSSGGIWLSQPP